METRNMQPQELHDRIEYLDSGLPARDDRDRLAVDIILEMRKGGDSSLLAKHGPLNAFRQAQAICQASIAQGRAPRGAEADDDLRAAIKGLDLPAAVAQHCARLTGESDRRSRSPRTTSPVR